MKVVEEARLLYVTLLPTVNEKHGVFPIVVAGHDETPSP